MWDIPYVTLSADAGGWTLFGLCMYGLLSRRWLITRGEADVHIRRAEVAEEALGKLNEQNAQLVSSMRMSVVSMDALRQAVTRNDPAPAGGGAGGEDA